MGHDLSVVFVWGDVKNCRTPTGVDPLAGATLSCDEVTCRCDIINHFVHDLPWR